MNPPLPMGDDHGFFARNWTRIAACALLATLVASALALLTQTAWEASVRVLVTRMAVTDVDDSIDGGSPLAAEERFANSVIVRDAVRSSIPTSPDTIHVDLAPDSNVMTFTAIGDTPDDATRLASNWSTAYIDQRRKVLVDTWNNRTVLAAAELDQLILDLGEARLSGNAVDIARVEAQRDATIALQADAELALEQLRTDRGAEVFGQTPDAASRTGLSLLPTALLGLLAGVAIGVLWSVLRGTRNANKHEADTWIDRASEGSLDGLLTTRTLEVPSYLDGDLSLADLAPIEERQPALLAPEPAITEPASAHDVHVPRPRVIAAATATTGEQPPITPMANGLLPGAPSIANPSGNGVAATFAPATSPSVQPAGATLRRTEGPLRVVTVEVARAATKAPTLSSADQAWADKISLMTDE